MPEFTPLIPSALMVVLSCPQCRTRLHVAPEKLGKTLFVCPSCTYPLEAANAVADDGAAPSPHDLPTVALPPAGGLTPATLREPAPAPPPRARVARPKPERPAPDSPAPAPMSDHGGRSWLVGGLCAGALALLAGTLFLTLGRGPSKEKEDGGDETATVAVADLLDVLALGKVLKEGDPETRNKAALSLAKAGREARAAFPALLEGLKDEDETFRNLVRNALDEAGPPDKEDFPTLSLALRDEDPDVRSYAVAALEFMDEDAWGEIDQVRELAEDEDPYVSAAAKKTLEKLEKEMLESLTRKLLDTKPDARAEAARALADLGGASKGATSGLVDALSDENDAVRVAAREALAQMGEEVVPVLAEAMVRNRNLEARRSALGTLASMGEDALDALPAIADLAEDPAIGGEASNALEGFGVFAVPVLAERVVRVPTEIRRDVYRNLIIRVGPRGVPALTTYISRKAEARNHFAAVVDKLGPAPEGQAVVPPPVGAGGTIFKDLLVQFEKWDRNKKGLLHHNDLRHAFGGNEKAAHDFLRRLDRDGKGHIQRHDYERWAKDHAGRLAREREAREKLRHAHVRLDKQVRTATKQDQTKAAQTLQRLRDAKPLAKAPVSPPGKAGVPPGKGKAPVPPAGKGKAAVPPPGKPAGRHEREVAVAALQAQRRKEQGQHRQAQAEVLRRQREVKKIHNKQGSVAKLATPKAYQPPRPQQVAHKPPTRMAPPPPRYSPPLRIASPPRRR